MAPAVSLPAATGNASESFSVGSGPARGASTVIVGDCMQDDVQGNSQKVLGNRTRQARQ